MVELLKTVWSGNGVSCVIYVFVVSFLFFKVKVALKMTALLNEGQLKYSVLTFMCLSIGEGRREEGSRRIYGLSYIPSKI